MIESFSTLIPASLSGRSGRVYYSGQSAFVKASPLYLLGLNPGGDPNEHASETVESHLEEYALNDRDFSAYRDEPWERQPPGTHKMQPRILHLFRSLELEPHLVPASNLVFVRSSRESDIQKEFPALAVLCWPFHQRVIERLEIRVVLCLGRMCGSWVRKRMNATAQGEEFPEENNRRWKSTSFMTSTGIGVVTLSHPSRADWTKPASDPTPFVKKLLRSSHIGR